MIPTADNFADLLREEVHTLSVMYRIGEMKRGYTVWTVWADGNIRHNDDPMWRGVDGFIVEGLTSEIAMVFAYDKRNMHIEDAYCVPFGGHVFTHAGGPCIQIVFMDARKQHRRAVRTMKA